jgi:hypothetical protein
MSSIDREAPLRFLQTAFQPDDWVAVFLKSYETGRVSQRVGPLSWVMHPRFQSWLRYKNARRFNVYVSVNAIGPGRRSRTREAIGAVRHVFLEADHDGPAVLAAVAARTDLPEPSYVLHSSPNRVHLFWRVVPFAPDHAEAVQKRLAGELGTDTAATPASQLTRLVGFFNHKYSPSHLVTVEYRAAERVYTPEEFPRVEPVVQPAPSAPVFIRHAASLAPLDRARRYMARVPPAIAGEHGDLHTFRVCCRLARGFGLSDRDALAVLSAWNARCQPPWSQQELLDKLRRARRYGREPVGALLQDHYVNGG